MDLAHVSFEGIVSESRVARPVGRTSVKAPWVRERPASNPCGGLAETRSLDAFVSWVLELAGIDGASYRPRLLQRRGAACLRQLDAPSAEAARRRIEESPGLLRDALNALLIGVSSFFRDPAVFDSIRDLILPELERKRGGLRLASVGCSGGQELYSVAMLLADAGLLERAELWGVDCRPDAVFSASRGRYPWPEVREMSEPVRQALFERDLDEWVVRRKVKARTRWHVADVVSYQAESPWDVVLLRNVTIYFQPERAAKTWERWVAQLAPRGHLVTGTADRPGPRLPLRRIAPCVYRKLEY